jgi:hypothetical protein
MRRIAAAWGQNVAPSLRSWCASRATVLGRLATVLLVVVAAWRAGFELPRSFWQLWSAGGVDLWFRHQEVRAWFLGYPVYSMLRVAVYPPATYAMLWPVGWLDFATARKIWVVTTLLMLAWLAYLLVRESGARDRLSRAFVVLTPLCVYATEETIRVGQLGIHLLPPLMVGLAMLARRRPGWRNDLVASALVLFALAKPQFAAPFFWIALFVPGRVRPALLTATGYLALTFLAASFQPGSAPLLFRKWTTQRPQLGLEAGYGSIHAWLVDLGLREALLPASLVIVLAFGAWTYKHRRAELWLLLGVAALVARFWAYHRSYDNVLLLLPMLALYRVAREGPDSAGADVTAGLLLASLWILSILGARSVIYSAQNVAFQWAETTIWVATLALLLYRARRVRPSPPALNRPPAV